MSTEPPGLRAAPTSATQAATGTVDATDAPVASPPGVDSPADVRRRRREPPAPAPRGKGKPPPRRKRKARKVHRVVRHVEVWSVAKVAAAFAACGYVVAMISGYLLWRAADRVGTISGIEGFLEDSGSYDNFNIIGSVVFRVAAIAGLVLAIVTVAVVVLAALLFNLISDLTGGIRMTVIDEDLIVAPARRPEADPARRPEADPARRRPEVGTAGRGDVGPSPPPAGDPPVGAGQGSSATHPAGPER